MKKISLFLLVFLSISFFIDSKGSSSNGIGLKFGYFGVPSQLLDLFLFEHPGISGNTTALEIRNYGPKGPRSVFSGLYTVEYSTMKGDGLWRISQGGARVEGNGVINQFNFTATIIMSLFPKLPVHPYIGGGIGIGFISMSSEGKHIDELGTTVEETFNEKKIIPVGHLPVGIMLNFNDQIEMRIEGGFKNGFYFSGSLVYNF
ncbi:MAG: hypothetical protein ABFR75_03060 [Acidobacteriota bacterium]